MQEQILVNSKVRASRILPIAVIVLALLVLGQLVGAQAIAQAQVSPKDQVGRLFFSAEERNVLEAVRQGVVDISAIPTSTEEIVTPTVDIPEIVFTPKFVKTADDTFLRDTNISFQGLIRSVNSNETRIIVDNNVLDTERIAAANEALGVNIRTDKADGPYLFVEDKLFKANVVLTHGDVIGAEGSVTKPANAGGRFIVIKRGN